MSFTGEPASVDFSGGSLNNTVDCSNAVQSAGFSPTLQAVGGSNSDMSVIGANGAALNTDAVMNNSDNLFQSGGRRRRKSRRSRKLRRSNKSRLNSKSKKSRSVRKSKQNRKSLSKRRLSFKKKSNKKRNRKSLR